MLAVLLLLLTTLAFAEEELDVYESSEVAAARRALAKALVAEGYAERRRRAPFTVYKRRGTGHPVVWVHDDGWVRLRVQPLSPRGVALQQIDEERQSVSPTVAAGASWGFSGPRIGRANAGRVLDAIHPELTALADAVAADAAHERENAVLPAQLEALWARADLSPEARRARLWELWDSRTETPEGEAARDAIERFLNAVVQTSATPFTAAETADYDARRSVMRRFVLRAATAPPR